VYWRSAAGSEASRLVIVGSILLLVATLVTIVGVPSNAGAAHPPAVFGYHVTWSTDTLFLFGILVGAVALPGLSMLVAGGGGP
jgi:hypothetical protein